MALVFETDETAVVVYFHHSPDLPARMPADAGARDLPGMETVKKWDGEQDSALMRGLRDPHGKVVCLERDDYWHGTLHGGCRTHTGTITMTHRR